MRRFIHALIGSTLTHLLLAGAVMLGLGLGGGWIEQRFRLGSAHPSAVVEVRWSGPSGADATPKRPRRQPRATIAAPQITGDSHSLSGAASGQQGDHLMPAGDLVAAQGAPEYPPLSRRAGEEGTVTLEFLLGPDGTAGEIGVARSSGHTRLDAAALNFLKSTRLSVPPGTAFDRKLNLSFVFRLQD